MLNDKLENLENEVLNSPAQRRRRVSPFSLCTLIGLKEASLTARVFDTHLTLPLNINIGRAGKDGPTEICQNLLDLFKTNSFP